MWEFIKDEPALPLFIVFCFLGLLVIAYYGGKDDERLLKQCRDDGHKEYECVSMLRRNSSGHSTMIIPMRTR